MAAAAAVAANINANAANACVHNLDEGTFYKDCIIYVLNRLLGGRAQLTAANFATAKFAARNFQEAGRKFRRHFVVIGENEYEIPELSGIKYLNSVTAFINNLGKREIIPAEFNANHRRLLGALMRQAHTMGHPIPLTQFLPAANVPLASTFARRAQTAVVRAGAGGRGGRRFVAHSAKRNSRRATRRRRAH